MRKSALLIVVVAWTGCGSVAPIATSDAAAPSDFSISVADAAVAEDAAVVEDAASANDAAVSDQHDLAMTPTLDMATCMPSSMASPHFVDPQFGTDDAQHGGASGNCAYATLTHALNNATGPIYLAQGTYAQLVTLSFNQELHCASSATVIQAKSAGNAGTVTLAGNANGIFNCTVDAVMPAFNACIAVTSAAATGSEHRVSGVTTTNCGAGVLVQSTGANVTIESSTFTTPGNEGVGWNGMNGMLKNNTFASSLSPMVACGGSSDGGGDSSLGGSGNLVVGGGKVSCTNCASCQSFSK